MVGAVVGAGQIGHVHEACNATPICTRHPRQRSWFASLLCSTLPQDLRLPQGCASANQHLLPLACSPSTPALYCGPPSCRTDAARKAQELREQRAALDEEARRRAQVGRSITLIFTLLDLHSYVGLAWQACSLLGR